MKGNGWRVINPFKHSNLQAIEQTGGKDGLHIKKASQFDKQSRSKNDNWHLRSWCIWTDPYIIESAAMRKYAVINYEYKNENHQYKMTACHPGAHHITALERDIKMIRDDLDLYTLATHYDQSHYISAENDVTIIEGMSVAFSNLDLFDVTIYLYTNGETEFTRRSTRDIAERGADITALKQSHKERRIQYEVFMHPYHQNFDIVVKNSNEKYCIEKEELI